MSVINRGTAVREIELTSYAEVVLAPEGGDLAHPAFGNLFVETTLLPDRDAILCTRRPRGDEPRRYLVHVLASRGRVGGGAEFETDRARFLGRLGQIAMPQALTTRAAAVGHQRRGAGSDRQRAPARAPAAGRDGPAFVRHRLRRVGGTGAGAHREVPRPAGGRPRRSRWPAGTASAELRHLNLDDRQANAIQRLASRLRFADPRLRQADAIARNRQSRDALWRHGISGDLPILLVVIDQEGDHGVVREALKAHEYCRLKGFAFDLVLLNEFGNGYRQEVQDQIGALIEASPSASWRDMPGRRVPEAVRRADARRRDHAARHGAHGAGDLERVADPPAGDAGSCGVAGQRG